MIEGRVRGLVGEVIAAGSTRTLAEQVDDIAELDHAVAMLQAALSVRIAAFAGARRREDLAQGGPLDTAGRGAPFEIALARRISKASVDYQLAFAEPLVADHRALLARCLEGAVSQAAAKHVVKEAEVLKPEQRHAIDSELAELAKQLTPGQARKAAARLVASTDPDAAAKKATLAGARKQVRAIVHGDATGTEVADLPVEQAVACWQALDHQARSMRSDGDDRSIREVLCDLFVERLTGQTTATDLNLEVGVVVSASSLLGVEDQPAKLVGRRGGDYGVLPAELVRELASSGQSWMRRLVCDPADGRLLDMDTTRRRFTGTLLRKFILYRDGVSRRPFSDTPIHDIDHAIRYADAGAPLRPTDTASPNATTPCATNPAGTSIPSTVTPVGASPGPLQRDIPTNRDPTPPRPWQHPQTSQAKKRPDHRRTSPAQPSAQQKSRVTHSVLGCHQLRRGLRLIRSSSDSV